jgi:CRP-like cAMP-binding protein
MEHDKLSQASLFRGLDEKVLEAMINHPLCTALHYHREDIIYSPSSFQRNLGVVLSGQVRVTKGELVISVLEPGDVFGVAALFNEFEDYATTLTATGDCDIVFFPQPLIAELLEQNPVFMKHYVQYLSERIHFLSSRLDALSAGTAEEKVLQFLLSNAGQNRTVSISATELTNRLNISRATLYRVFDTLESEKIIKRGPKMIQILDFQKFKI